MYGEAFLAVVFAIFGILQIILFFKLWRMTNRVADIHKTLLGDSVIDTSWGGEEIRWYCDSKIAQAKRMKAIGEDGADIILKGLIYDIENSFIGRDYRRLSAEILEEAKKLLANED